MSLSGEDAPAHGHPLLKARGLTKRFGALAVVDGVDFEVEHDQAVGIVGPNGAGKTTLLNLISGAIPASAGVIMFDGTDLGQTDAAERCRRGIGRSHQVPKPFRGMTVFENLVVAAEQGGARHGDIANDHAVEVLRRTGMAKLANRRAATLGLLDLKRLELARALATGPKLLLLDEIGGGLTDGEALELVEIILELRCQKITIVWIEHIVHMLVRVVTCLVCMDAGRVLAQGKPETVLSNPLVMSAYLGQGAL